MRKWSKESIASEIVRMHKEEDDLNYANIAQHQVALLRAATRYFGSWRAAVEYAGLDYEQIRRYKTWTRDRILERIRELHSEGQDLSWRHVSTVVDPQLGIRNVGQRRERSAHAAEVSDRHRMPFGSAGRA